MFTNQTNVMKVPQKRFRNSAYQSPRVSRSKVIDVNRIPNHAFSFVPFGEKVFSQLSPSYRAKRAEHANPWNEQKDERQEAEISNSLPNSKKESTSCGEKLMERPKRETSRKESFTGRFRLLIFFEISVEIESELVRLFIAIYRGLQLFM